MKIPEWQINKETGQYKKKLAMSGLRVYCQTSKIVDSVLSFSL
jgi:hypothetical protein